MSFTRSLMLAAAAVGPAFVAALGAGRIYDIDIRPRAADPLVSLTTPGPSAMPPREDSGPLELRLVDSGGVGVPLTGDWGTDYSHDLKVFRDVILEQLPYVDDGAFEQVSHDWHTYVERMVGYGNNAIAVPLLLELIDFDR